MAGERRFRLSREMSAEKSKFANILARGETAQRVAGQMERTTNPFLSNPYIQQLGATLLGQLNRPMDEYQPILDRDDGDYKSDQAVGEYSSTAIASTFADVSKESSIGGNRVSREEFLSDIAEFNVPHNFVESGGKSGTLPSVARDFSRSTSIQGEEFGQGDWDWVSPTERSSSKVDYNPEWTVSRNVGKNTEYGRWGHGAEPTEGDYDRSFFTGKENVAEKLHRVFGGSRLDDALTKMETRLMEQEKYDSPLAKMLNMKIGPEVTRITDY